MFTDIDGPTEAEIKKHAALSIAVLGLGLIADGYDEPRQAAEIVLRELRERYGVTAQTL